MPIDREVFFDHFALQSTASALEAAADEMEATMPAALDRLWETAVAEASRNTLSGKPAPIFWDALNRLSEFIDGRKDFIVGVVDLCRADAANLRHMSEKSQASADASAAALSTLQSDRAAYDTGTLSHGGPVWSAPFPEAGKTHPEAKRPRPDDAAEVESGVGAYSPNVYSREEIDTLAAADKIRDKH